MAMLAFDSGQFAEAKQLAKRGLDDTVRERWARLEGFNRRLLGDIAVRDRDLPEARFQYKEALKIVPASDMRIQALIELSLACMEFDDGNKERAAEQGAIAAGHFEKLRMPRDAEEARRIAAELPPSGARRV
jgi:hypothetical protein